MSSAHRQSPREASAILEAAENLRGGREALRQLGVEKTAAVWFSTVKRFRNDRSPDRQRLEPPMEKGCGLSRKGLRAGLEAVLGGVDGEPAERLFAQARIRRQQESRIDTPPSRGPIVVWLASNLPGLAVQPLLPALAAGRPVLLKSPSTEPYFAGAFVKGLIAHEPRLAGVVAARVWRGGDRTIEGPLLEIASRILVYGEAATIRDLDQRAPGKVFGFGPKTSLAIVTDHSEVKRRAAARGIARDIALFDQRGCLSVTGVYVIGGPKEVDRWSRSLAEALAERADEWPPGPMPTATASAIRQARGEAEMTGLEVHEIKGDSGSKLGAGTVIGKNAPFFRAGPGGRTVGVYPLPEPERLGDILAPWRGRLQGAALHGDAAWGLEPTLRALGVSRCAPPGELQSPDALWHNGGVHPLDLMWV
jgi:hypothetical protein